VKVSAARGCIGRAEIGAKEIGHRDAHLAARAGVSDHGGHHVAARMTSERVNDADCHGFFSGP
jgi:hypothetical protein